MLVQGVATADTIRVISDDHPWAEQTSGRARLRLLCEACHPRKVEQTRAGSRVQNGIVRACRAQSSIVSPMVDAYAVEFSVCRHPCKSFVKLRHGCPGHAQGSVQSTVPGCFTRKVCLSASVPALGRTRHPFAVSDSEEPSQKIEFVFSASPETIRREPREFDLLRSVGKMQDLAVCAWFILLF
jgi:hypothetical protein